MVKAREKVEVALVVTKVVVAIVCQTLGSLFLISHLFTEQQFIIFQQWSTLYFVVIYKIIGKVLTNIINNIWLYSNGKIHVV